MDLASRQLAAEMSSKVAVHIGKLADDGFRSKLQSRNDVSLFEFGAKDYAEGDFARLQAAVAIQITSAKSDVPSQLHVKRTILERAPRLLVVSTGGAGYDTVDLEACTASGVLVVNQSGGNSEAVAEHTLGFMLTLSKRIGETDREMRREAGISRLKFKGNDVYAKTLGIVGLGQIGKRLVELVAPLKMQILAYDPYVGAREMESVGVTKCDLGHLLVNSDFVSLHCPLTEETRNLIGPREFALMRASAFFISTARGSIHDELALAEVLQAGRIAGAGLDVWVDEPPAPDHPLLRLSNVLASPHTAGGTHEARDRVGTMAADQILDVLDGKRPPRLLNPGVWPRFCERRKALDV